MIIYAIMVVLRYKHVQVLPDLARLPPPALRPRVAADLTLCPTEIYASHYRVLHALAQAATTRSPCLPPRR